MPTSTDIAALRSKAANVIGLLTAESLTGCFALDALADVFDDMFRQLEAERQRADKAQADMQFECDAHIETAESWREWKLRAVTAEAENAELRAKLANPVASPRVEGLFRQVQFERDCEWIDEIRKAGFTVKE